MSQKIKMDYDRIIDVITEVDNRMMIVIINEIFTDKEISEIRIGKLVMTPEMWAIVIMFKKKNYYISYLKKVIERNNFFFKSFYNTSMSPEEIEKMLIKFKENPYFRGISRYFFILLYFLSENIFGGEAIEYLKQKCKESIKEGLEKERKSKKKERINKDLYKLTEELAGSKAETTLNALVQEDEKIQDIYDEHDPYELAEEYDCFYDSKKKEFNHVKRGFLFFIKNNFSDLLKSQQNAYDLAMSNLELSGSMDKEKYELEKMKQIYNADKDKILRIKKTNKALKKENKRLNERVLKKIDKSTNKDLENKVHNLQKENNYHLTRIEKLEEQIAILEEEKILNKELAENIIIEEKQENKAVELPEFQNIVVLGGRWSSNNRKDVINFLPNNEIEFIDADKTLRHFDRIANADIILFDTSYNGHSYYYRAKKCHNDFYHINVSNLHEVKKVFEGN